MRKLESVIRQLTSLAGHIILPEHVLQQIQPAQVLPSWMSLQFLSALPKVADGQFPSANDLLNWYVAVLDFSGYSQAKIARQLGLDTRTVRRALSEAREKFPSADPRVRRTYRNAMTLPHGGASWPSGTTQSTGKQPRDSPAGA